MKLLKKALLGVVSAVAGLFVFAGSASAATDVTGVTTAITDAGTAIGTVGSAVLVMTVGIFVYKWIKRAL